MLNKDCKSNNSFQQSKLITNTLSWPPTEWNEPTWNRSFCLTTITNYCYIQGPINAKHTWNRCLFH
jgi:hypothetical protein